MCYLIFALIKSRKKLQSSSIFCWQYFLMWSKYGLWEFDLKTLILARIMTKTCFTCCLNRYFPDLTLPLSVWRNKRHKPQTHLTWLEQEECGIKSLQSIWSSVHFIKGAQLDSLKNRPRCSGLRFKPLETNLWEHQTCSHIYESPFHIFRLRYSSTKADVLKNR